MSEEELSHGTQLKVRIDEREKELILDIMNKKRDPQGQPLYKSASHFAMCAIARLIREDRGERYHNK